MCTGCTCSASPACKKVAERNELERKYLSHAKWALALFLGLIYMISLPFWSESFDMALDWKNFVFFMSFFRIFCALEVILAVQALRKAS